MLRCQEVHPTDPAKPDPHSWTQEQPFEPAHEPYEPLKSLVEEIVEEAAVERAVEGRRRHNTCSV